VAVLSERAEANASWFIVNLLREDEVEPCVGFDSRQPTRCDDLVGKPL